MGTTSAVSAYGMSSPGIQRATMKSALIIVLRARIMSSSTGLDLFEKEFPCPFQPDLA